MPGFTQDQKWIAGVLLSLLLLLAGWIFNIVIGRMNEIQTRLNIVEHNVASMEQIRLEAFAVRAQIARNTESVSWLRANCVMINRSGIK